MRHALSEGLKPFISETALSSLYESIRFYYSQHNAQKTILNNEKQTLVESFKKLTFMWGVFLNFCTAKDSNIPTRFWLCKAKETHLARWNHVKL